MAGHKHSVLVGLVAEGDWGALLYKAKRRIFPTTTLRADLTPTLFSVEKGPAVARGPRSGRRLLMIGPSFNRDGAPSSQLELARGLVALGWTVTSVAPRDGPLVSAYAAANIAHDLWPLLATDSNLSGRHASDTASIAKAIAAFAPDVVYVNTLDAFPAVNAAFQASIPVLWNIREGEHWRVRLADRNPKIAALALGAFSRAGRVIFVSNATRQAWTRFTPDQAAAVIYNAPPAPFPANARRAFAEPPVLVSVGTICARKNQIEILRALDPLQAGASPRLRLRLVGRLDPAYATTWRHAVARARKVALEARGEVSDVGAELAGATALIHAARAEAFPRVFFEAAAADTPIIATRAGGTEERLQHGISALLYDVGDVETLRRHILQITTDPALGPALAAEARKALIESWTFDEMARAYHSHLAALAAGVDAIGDGD